ncbi:MAG: FecR domain-containing protein [Verrucomicrobiaceae bacterium]|nr:FecR domain-containing protein [Verrucomicrobiaceae bacterium]
MTRADELLAAYLDDALTEAEHAELNAWLKADPANVRRFVEATAREHQLRIVVQARRDFPLSSKPKPMRWRSVVAWAAAAVFVLGGALWMLWQPSEAKAHLAGNLDGVTIERAGAVLQAENAFQLHSGDVIASTQPGARIEFESESTQFVLAARSSVALRELRGQKRFELLAGSVSAEVAKQRDGAMIWLTDDAEAQVLGTKFELSEDGLLTKLDVSEGAVQFKGRHADASTVVRAGQLAATDSRGLTSPESRAVWNVPDRRSPSCEHITFRSEEIRADIGVNVLLPPRYASQPSQRFPVIYFHHALGGDEHSEAVKMAPALLAAMQNGTLPPCVVVFPNGGPGYTPRAIISGRVFAGELPRFIDSRYRTQATAGQRLFCGTGFGGKRAILLGTLHADVFGTACAIDDTFHGGTPSFFRIIDAMRRRVDRFPPHLLLLRSSADASAQKLVSELKRRDISIEHQTLASSTAEVLTEKLRALITSRWKP